MILLWIRALIRRFGFDVTRYGERRKHSYPVDFMAYHKDIIERVKPFTMTSEERLFALIEAVRYLVRNKIEGDFVECGVYKAGSAMAIALALMMEGDMERRIYLFDTFDGMPRPGAMDADCCGHSAMEVFDKLRVSDVSSHWLNASLEEVQRAMSSTEYPKDNIHFIKGMVETTIPQHAPNNIALLRLDTDFYSSTRHELAHLYPRITSGGIVIIDDYGHFKGARLAVDEYLSQNQLSPLLHRIDYTGRLLVKDR